MITSHTYKLAAYPKEIILRDGTPVVFKPMTSADADPLLQFFRRIPAEDLELLTFEAVAVKEAAAIKAAEWVGFVQVAVLGSRARDVDGHPRDLVLLEIPLGKWFEWWY